ncbi:MAG: hypothetical protein EZS28_005835 [Streblomastix strix]|uniref:Uncharacterized protein n=1 Tax=Streblomastix strix TaxID=222440 RepID=A0A5J4WWL4_9EUKA|nr:MAG: hypothetical protein EZS28_005835 [Streblomastix strix]
MSSYGQKKLNPFKNNLHSSLLNIDELQKYLTQPVAVLLEKTSNPSNRIDAFLQLTPLISTRVDSDIGKIPSPVLQLFFETIKSIIKNHRRIGNIDNREKEALYKFLRKFCSFATIAGRVFNWPQCILFLSHLFPIDKTKFIAGRDKNSPIQRIPRTTKNYSTYKDLRQFNGQEIHFHLLDKFLKYNGSTFLQSTLKFLTNGQIQGYPAFEMMISLMRIYYSNFIYVQPRYCPIKEVSQIQTLIVHLPKIYQFPPIGKEGRIDMIIRMVEFCGNQTNASDNSMEKFLLKISIILLEDGLYQRVQLQNPQAINIVDPNSQQNQFRNIHTLMMKGVHFLNVLAKCAVGIRSQQGQSVIEKPREINFADITSISNEIYKPSNGNEGVQKLQISLLNFGGQLLCENLQVKQASGQDNMTQMEMLELAEVQRIYANAFIIPDQLLLDLFVFWEKIPLVQDGARNDPDKIQPTSFFHKAIQNAKLELFIPALTYLERKYWIEPTTQQQGQSTSSQIQLHQVAQCRITPIIVDPSDILQLNNLFTLCKQQEMRRNEVDAAIDTLNKKKIDKDIIPHFETPNENKFLSAQRLLLLYIQILREKRILIPINPFELIKIPLEGQERQNLNNNNPPTFMNNYNKLLPSIMIFGSIPRNHEFIIHISEEDDIQTLRLRIARELQIEDFVRIKVNFNNKDVTYSRDRVLCLADSIW